MSLSCRSVISVFALCAACSNTTAPGVSDLEPPIVLQGTGTVESRLDARLQMPVSVVDGMVITRLVLTNALQENVSSGACTLASDARALNGTAWRNVSPSAQGCTRQLLTATPGGSMSLSVVADLGLLRAVGGGAGGLVVLRVRHIVAGANVNYLVQSAEQQVMVP